MVVDESIAVDAPTRSSSPDNLARAAPAFPEPSSNNVDDGESQTPPTVANDTAAMDVSDEGSSPSSAAQPLPVNVDLGGPTVHRRSSSVVQSTAAGPGSGIDMSTRAPSPISTSQSSASGATSPRPSARLRSSASSNAAHRKPKASSANEAPSHSLPGSIAVPDLSLELPTQVGRGRKRKSAGEAASSAKRKKANEDPASSDIASSTNDVQRPPWVVKSLTLFKSTKLGQEWDLLVSAWLKLEECAQFNGNSKLGTRKRPPIIHDWIQRARASNYSPHIDNIDTYASDFNQWWRGIQPQWRYEPMSEVLRRDEGDYEPLRLVGPNGLLSIVAGLYFWGCAVQTSPARRKTSWMESLQDVAHVIERLI